ncbi:SIS domain-containing protein [Psychrosphaera haliotis]|uniref:SIS domain-containing protein n=1 Tax=Psychrosphaera haliotis TaxID=555083 RepID=A0A6N8FCY9_9GAMM|nr:SIS domain-containing protein [Psychrosphaera haliotis]MDB2373027.1 SIS domain-containing protein [Psychrosphaera haliotis]MUH72602.1 SIS domain-containing protein [Psychrosphaera haliotis]
MNDNKIKQLYTSNIQNFIASGDQNADNIALSAAVIAQTLLSGNKVITCADSMAKMMAEHFAGILVNFYEIERPCLPAISLNDHVQNCGQEEINLSHFQDRFARQIRAIGNEQDVLVVFSLNNKEPSIKAALETALTRDIKVVAFTSDDGGEIAGMLGDNDIEIRLPTNKPSRTLEIQLFTVHVLSELIDEVIFSM